METHAARIDHLDKNFLWHPFTPMRQWMDGEIVVIEAGEGFELIDTHGRRYIDGYASLWCNLHGHRVEAIDTAIREQLGRVAHATLLGAGSAPAAELAERLVNLAGRLGGEDGGLCRVFLSDSGASAVEVALKMAYQYWRCVGRPDRHRFIALREGYHGDTVGSMSVGGVELYHELFRPLLAPATLADCPCPYVHPRGERAGPAVLEQIDQAIAAAPDEYCAVIVEPMVQGAGGMLTQPPGFMRGLRELTRQRNVLLIADEVATGFGRTGRLFACEHEAVQPDLMCLGKALTGGYLPVSATLASGRVFDAFCGGEVAGGYGGRTFFHGHTFAGNALGCAAANASIDLMLANGLLESLGVKVERMTRRLGELADHPHVGDIRQCGLMVGIDLRADKATRRPFDASLRVGAAVCRQAIRRGLMIRPLGDVIVLMPAPAMDLATLDRMMDIVVETIGEVRE